MSDTQKMRTLRSYQSRNKRPCGPLLRHLPAVLDTTPSRPNTGKTPKDIIAFLDNYDTRQQDAKETLAIAACNHDKRLAQCKTSNVEISKSNILLGPTGTGKTFLPQSTLPMDGIWHAVFESLSLWATRNVVKQGASGVRG